jgi:hypothetical protein
MRYFRIEGSLNTKIMGHLPQTKDVIHHCDVWETATFIDNIGYKKINFLPIVSNLVLFPKAKTTDLLDGGGIGFSLKFVMSAKLKNILEKYSENRFQFFECPIFHKNIEYKEYYIINPYKIDMEFIDYGKSEIFLMKNTFDKEEKLNIFTHDEFVKKKKEIDDRGYPYSIYIDRFIISENIVENFFALENIEGGRGYFVSEKLKQEIEVARCTGIEFQPSELLFNEWSISGGERDKIYGKSW